MTGHPEAEPFCAEPCGHADCAGVATFPSEPYTGAGRCEYVWGCPYCLTMAEAWAWRCADTMSDSAQSRLDSLADGDCLRSAMIFVAAHERVSLMAMSTRAQQCIAFGLAAYAYENARASAHAAFQACPQLRD